MHAFEGRPQLLTHKLEIERELKSMIHELEAESKPEQKASQVFSEKQPQNEDG